MMKDNWRCAWQSSGDPTSRILSLTEDQVSSRGRIMVDSMIRCRSTGGDCFAPLWGLLSSLLYFMYFMGKYHRSNGFPESIVEDGVLGNLAPPGDLEESASHHRYIKRTKPAKHRNSGQCSGGMGAPINPAPVLGAGGKPSTWLPPE